MKIILHEPNSRETGTITVERRPGDKRIGKPGWGLTDPSSTFLYRLLLALNASGFDLIKREMSKDGHLVSEHVHYLKTRHNRTEKPHVYVRDQDYVVRIAVDEYNKHQPVHLEVSFDVYGIQPDCAERFAALSGTLYEDADGRITRMEPKHAAKATGASAAADAGTTEGDAAAREDGPPDPPGGADTVGRGRRVVRPHRQRLGEEGDRHGQRPPQDQDRRPPDHPKLRSHRLAGDPRGHATGRVDAAVASAPQAPNPPPPKQKKKGK